VDAVRLIREYMAPPTDSRELSIMGVTRVGIRDAYYAAIRGNGRVYAVFSRRRSNDATGGSQTRESPRQTVFPDIRNTRQSRASVSISIHRKSRRERDRTSTVHARLCAFVRVSSGET